MRLLFFLIIIVAVIWVVRKKFQASDKSALDDPAASAKPSAKPPESGAVSKTGPTESMLCCAHCGVFIPASEALQGAEQDSGQSYCCEQHRSLHKQ